MSVINAIPLLLGDEGYNISRSVRLRSSASAYFGRSFTVAGTNATKRTYSMWVKRGQLGAAAQQLMGCYYSGGPVHQVYLSNDQIVASTFYSGAFQNITTTAVLRDPSAWYHIVYSIDTTQATAANRQTIYVNGVSLAYTGTNVPQNSSLPDLTNGNSMNIGAQGGGVGASNYFDGYFAEINVIDGQALTPSSFGETDTITGVWKPKKYAGTYGTNGFYLNFSDNSSNTATTIGKDYSGNGNNWTPNNISVTAGVTYDSMIDVPTLYADGGNGRGNYCTLTPLLPSGATLSNGNLTLFGPSGAYGRKYGSIGVLTGKWYFEARVDGVSAGNNFMAGIYALSGTTSETVNIDATNNVGALNFSLTMPSGNYQSSGLGASAVGDIMMIAFDADTGKVWLGAKGTWANSGNPATGANPVYTLSAPTEAYVPVLQAFSTGSGGSANFGQRPFAYTPPTGFKALNTQNLPAPTILKGNKYFDALLWTSTATVKDITGSSFQPDLVWVKSRSSASANEGYHHLVDAVRGAGKVLSSNVTDAEYWTGTNNSVQAFLPNGFTAGDADGLNGNAMVSWLWKANGSAVTNTSGSITSQVNAGTSQGFSVVTYTGTGANATVGHGLGVAPSMIIIKDRGPSASTTWIVYHKNMSASPEQGYLALQGTGAYSALSNVFNNTAPTSAVFTVGTNASTNANGDNYVAYCFSEVAGFSKFGSYTGNGSADGPFVFCGFRPRYVMVKRSDGIGDWIIYDSARAQINVMDVTLYADLSSQELNAGTPRIDFLSNGFKLRNTGESNQSGGYIFAAFAESPFKNSLAR